ncbi:MAG TPA: hypothetical protein VK459_01910 [Polyangiaceae bacterium]|jgi:hypothetical protein|nr:hypothetical protein [Polyangiaceae bacterium]
MAPVAGHHQHLFSPPAIEALLATPSGGPKSIGVPYLIAFVLEVIGATK